MEYNSLKSRALYNNWVGYQDARNPIPKTYGQWYDEQKAQELRSVSKTSTTLKGKNTYWTKPFDTTELHRVIDPVLKKARQLHKESTFNHAIREAIDILSHNGIETPEQFTQVLKEYKEAKEIEG